MKRLTGTIILLFCILTAFAQAGYIRHSVKWFEDINSISMKYNVPVEVIMRVNNLSSSALSTRQVILIPTSREYWKEDEDVVKIVPVDSSTRVSAAKKPETVSNGKVKMTVALDMTGGSTSMNAGSMDLYCGAILAAKDLGKEGISVDLTGIDTNKGVDRAQLSQSNVVIGPIKADDLTRILGVADSTTIVVSPLDHKADRLCKDYGNFVQAAPMGCAQYEGAVAWAGNERLANAENTAQNYIIFYWENDRASLQEALTALGDTPCKTVACEPSGEIENLEAVYDPNAYNVAILAITNEAVLGNTLRNLRIFAKDSQMLLMCNSKAMSYESIPEENLHKGNVHSLCPYFVDYGDARTLDFIHSYRALFNAEPSQFAFQGYDLAYHFGKLYANNGENWKQAANNEAQDDMLQVSFSLKQHEGDKGLSNHGIRKVLYDTNYRVLLLK